MRKWILVVALAVFFAAPAEASRSTYTRRFGNGTSEPIAVFLADEDAGVWEYQFTVYPGIPVVQRDIPRRGLESRRLLWGADIGADFLAVDLMRNDFGTADWRWDIRERW